MVKEVEWFGWIDEKGNEIVEKYNPVNKMYFISIMETGTYWVEDIMAATYEDALYAFQVQRYYDTDGG